MTNVNPPTTIFKAILLMIAMVFGGGLTFGLVKAVFPGIDGDWLAIICGGAVALFVVPQAFNWIEEQSLVNSRKSDEDDRG